ncbi:MAG: hypothetical protein JSR59_13875 [Proteobacteria bacterium]|nr:hypothetical protein [Pseudomonadota bacterium]
MSSVSHTARINHPLATRSAEGLRVTIPPGPCLIEQIDSGHADVVWGKSGENSAVVELQEIASAERKGDLVLLD